MDMASLPLWQLIAGTIKKIPLPFIMVKFLLLFFLSLNSFALSERYVTFLYAQSKRGFFRVKRDLKQRYIVGQFALLSNEYVSIKASVSDINDEWIVWRLADRKIPIPFKEGEIILVQPFESLLLRSSVLADAKKLQALKKSRYKVKDEISEKRLHGINLKILGQSQVSQSYEAISRDDISGQNSFVLRASYLMPILRNIYLAPGVGITTSGLRVNKNNYSQKSFDISADLYFLLSDVLDFESFIPYFSVGMTIGLSSTNFETYVTRGQILKIPSVDVGIFMPINNKYGISLALNLEAHSVRESDGDIKNYGNSLNLGASASFTNFF